MNLISFVFLIGIMWACENPFTTREPEPPDTQSPSSFIPPTSPEFVFINLQFAFRERNVENYLRSFVDSSRSEKRFTFVPDQSVANANQITFLNWNLENERLYFVQLLQTTPEDSVINLSLIEENRQEESETATFLQNYEIIVRHNRTNNIPITFRGRATFLLERNESGDWAIYRWEDNATEEGVQPWSELKALFQ